MSNLPAPVPADALNLVTAIMTRDASFWGAIRDLNDGDDDKGLLALAETDARDKLIEQLRRKYFPRAARVTVDQWGVYTWSRTGRVIRKVWAAPQPTA